MQIGVSCKLKIKTVISELQENKKLEKNTFLLELSGDNTQPSETTEPTKPIERCQKIIYILHSEKIKIQ